jgi:N6-adenosine-specific RNA methylase IME4
VRRVEQGSIPVKVAAEVAKLSPDVQKELVGQPEAKLRGAIKSAARAQREHQLATRTAEAAQSLGATLYSVIYADPPWRFEPFSRETGLDRAADNHYPTISSSDIAKMPIPAAPDCALFLWATAPMLPEAIDVMRAWGFTYRTHLVWIKDRIGTGYWCRNRHEILLIGSKGNVPAPAPGEQPQSALEAAVGQHSEKPARFAELIEQMFPHAPRIELFARSPRQGWDVWGNEVVAEHGST